QAHGGARAGRKEADIGSGSLYQSGRTMTFRMLELRLPTSLCPLWVAVATLLIFNPAPPAAEAFAAGARSQWVYFDSNGQLAYKTLKEGDRIMDFSSAGYKGGGGALPSVRVRASVGPASDDSTEVIQEALNSVSKLEPVDACRDAVLLKPGVYRCKGALVINASGVVLRGSRSGANGTTIEMVGTPHVCINVSGS